MTTNAHEALARHKKVEAMADEFWSYLTDGERTDPRFVQLLRRWNTADRDALAKAAGQTTPRPETWGAFCDRIAVLIDRERNRLVGQHVGGATDGALTGRTVPA